MKYNQSLDFAALAIQASQKGRHVLAARLFARAVTASDADDALRIIEASNAKAHEDGRKLAAAAAKAKAVKARRAVKASDDEECSDEDLEDLELGADLVDDIDPDAKAVDNDEDALEEDPSQEALAGDLDELEDEDELEGDDAEDQATAFASILASMTPKAKPVVAKKAAARVRTTK